MAPTLIPRKPGDRVKTDRRDAVTLAGLHRAGQLTPVWVPDPDREAVRDLTRAREDMKAAETKARQRLGAFLLRHDRVYSGKSRWTQAHFRWLEEQKFEISLQQLVFQEYVDATIAAGKRTDALVAQMHEMLTDWSERPTVEAPGMRRPTPADSTTRGRSPSVPLLSACSKMASRASRSPEKSHGSVRQR